MRRLCPDEVSVLSAGMPGHAFQGFVMTSLSIAFDSYYNYSEGTGVCKNNQNVDLADLSTSGIRCDAENLVQRSVKRRRYWRENN